MFVRCTASAFRKLLSVHIFSNFPFGFEGRMWDLIVSVPDHCLSFCFENNILYEYQSGFRKACSKDTFVLFISWIR